jgi:flotillin
MGFITGGPNEAIVVSGCLHSQPLIVVGGWAFVIPCIQKVQRLSLNIMTLKVSSPKVYTMHGVPLSVTGIAQVQLIIHHSGIVTLHCCAYEREQFS